MKQQHQNKNDKNNNTMETTTRTTTPLKQHQWTRKPTTKTSQQQQNKTKQQQQNNNTNGTTKWTKQQQWKQQHQQTTTTKQQQQRNNNKETTLKQQQQQQQQQQQRNNNNKKETTTMKQQQQLYWSPFKYVLTIQRWSDREGVWWFQTSHCWCRVLPRKSSPCYYQQNCWWCQWWNSEKNPRRLAYLPQDWYSWRYCQCMLPTEFLNSLNLSGLPECTLKLKINTVVILLQNLDIYAGHCNGTRYLVKVIGQYRVILHKIDVKDDDKNKIWILPWIPCHYQGKTSHLSSPDFSFPWRLLLHWQSTEPRDNLPKNVAFYSLKMFGHMVKLLLLTVGTLTRAVTFQRLQGKKGAWEEIYQKCSVQRSS